MWFTPPLQKGSYRSTVHCPKETTAETSRKKSGLTAKPRGLRDTHTYRHDESFFGREGGWLLYIYFKIWAKRLPNVCVCERMCVCVGWRPFHLFICLCTDKSKMLEMTMEWIWESTWERDGGENKSQGEKVGETEQYKNRNTMKGWSVKQCRDLPLCFDRICHFTDSRNAALQLSSAFTCWAAVTRYYNNK